ncbi:MAG: DsrH/TusB family sulfur metabolism protein [Promethearchaeota archaeon]
MAENKNILYLFGFSERMVKHLEKLIPLLKSQIKKGSIIKLVFIHDGVINSTSKGKIPESIKELMNLNVVLYTMIPDAKARGISIEHIQNKIKPINYEELVDLIDTTPKIISWM